MNMVYIILAMSKSASHSIEILFNYINKLTNLYLFITMDFLITLQKMILV
jgi:hypothetical protein